jgi:probable HAF family extracellular repeat protein
MKRMTFPLIMVVAILLPLFFSSAPISAAQETPIIFGNIPFPSIGPDNFFQGINNSGQIVGWYQDQTNGLVRGFLFSDGTYTWIDYPTALTGTAATGINDCGQIVGWYYDNMYGTTHSFLFSDGTYTTIDPPAALSRTDATGINNYGQIVGWYFDETYGLVHGFLFSDGTYTTIDYPGALWTMPQAINDSGQIVGGYYDTNGLTHGFLFSDGTYTTIDCPNASSVGHYGTAATGINDSGQIVGGYYDTNRLGHGFLFSDGTYTTIDYPTALSGTAAAGINDSGQIVGAYWDASGQHGFVAQTVGPALPDLVILDAKMVSPHELGMGISVKFPEDMPNSDNVKRWVDFNAAINQKDKSGSDVVLRTIDKRIDITKFTEAGVEWGKLPGEQNQMYDSTGRLRLDTPLRIDLNDPNGDGNTEDAVPRFTDNVRVELTGVAFWEEADTGTCAITKGPSSKVSQLENDVEILLPVVVLHGYIHRDWWNPSTGYPIWDGIPVLETIGAGIAYDTAYAELSKFLETQGYTKHPDVYRTLWDPKDPETDYTNPWKASPETITQDMDKLMVQVEKYSYAQKVNLIGHSFGGLVARYYANQEPARVNTVITAGTPHEGTTRFWEWCFEEYHSKADADAALTISSGPQLGKQCIIPWTVPIYECLYTAVGDPITQLPYQNTFTYGPGNGVKYYSLFTDYHDSPASLLVNKKEGQDWYNVVAVNQAKGDDYMLAQSAGAFGQGVRINERASSEHATLLNNSEVQSKIYSYLTGNPVIAPLEGNQYSYYEGDLFPGGYEEYAVPIQEGASEATLEISWPGSDFDLVLYDPNDNEINPEVAATDPNISFIGSDTFEQYTVLNPTPGEWLMVIRAIEAPKEGEAYSAFAYVTVNLEPVADAGGIYQTVEGSSITLDASASYDQDRGVLQYRWDFNGDGQWDTEWSASPTISHVWIDDYEGPIFLEVTDGKCSSFDDAWVVSKNVAPAAEAGSSQKVEVFTPVSFLGNFTDPGWLDTHTIEWDFGDGTGTTGTLTPTHSYNMVGNYIVTLTVTDDDGGVATDTLSVEVAQKYAIWANLADTKAILWSGSGEKLKGNVHSNGGITMSGSDNAIDGIVYYASKFAITGSKDTFTSSQKISLRPMPVHYELSDYQPGGKGAVGAQNAGKYHYINGNFNVSKSGTVLDGLYYVKGNVGISGSNVKGTFTIVAEGTISISGSGMNCTPYLSGLLFFSNGASLTISGSNGSLGGIIYAPTGQITISGSGNRINGSIFGNKITLSGSNMVMTAK